VCKKATELKASEIQGDEKRCFFGVSPGHAGREAAFWHG